MNNLYNDLISRQKEVFSEEEQETLRTTPVAIMGCGGLGGTVIEQFVRAGFEQLTIIDQDVFDETNLNRQIRSNLDSIGKSKVQTTKKLDDGTILKYTSSKWLRPNGDCIDGNGIIPDYEVEQSDNKDNQYEKAISLLK